MIRRLYVIGLSVLVAFLSSSTMVFAAQAMVSWNANTESDLAGYRLFCSETSLLNVTVAQAKANTAVTKTTYSAGTIQCVVDNLALDKNYYFRLTAYDQDNNESGFNVDGSGQPSEAVFFLATGAATPTPDPTQTTGAGTTNGLLTPYNRDGINDAVTFASDVVEVTVMNLQGRTLYHVQNQGGIGSWFGTDQQGRELPSGAYIVRLRHQSGEKKIQRWVIVK